MLKVCLKTIVPHCCQLFRIGLASCRTRDSGQNILTLPSKQRQSKIIQGSAPLRSPRGVLLPASLPDTSFNWRYTEVERDCLYLFQLSLLVWAFELTKIYLRPNLAKLPDPFPYSPLSIGVLFLNPLYFYLLPSSSASLVGAQPRLNGPNSEAKVAGSTSEHVPSAFPHHWIVTPSQYGLYSSLHPELEASPGSQMNVHYPPLYPWLLSSWQQSLRLNVWILLWKALHRGDTNMLSG